MKTGGHVVCHNFPPQLRVCGHSPRQTSFLTDISRGSTRCRHDVVFHHLGQAEVADHDLRVLVLAVVQDVLWLHGDRDGTAVQTLASSQSLHDLFHFLLKGKVGSKSHNQV